MKKAALSLAVTDAHAGNWIGCGSRRDPRTESCSDAGGDAGDRRAVRDIGRSQAQDRVRDCWSDR